MLTAAQRSRHITTMQEQPVASQMIDRTQKQSQQKQAVLPAITELETDGNSLVHNVDGKYSTFKVLFKFLNQALKAGARLVS